MRDRRAAVGSAEIPDLPHTAMSGPQSDLEPHPCLISQAIRTCREQEGMEPSGTVSIRAGERDAMARRHYNHKKFAE